MSSDWQQKSTTTLKIPINNRLTPEILPQLFRELKIHSLIHEAPRIIALIEQPNEINSESFYFSSPYFQPLPKLDPSIQNPALARCILCGNYFWIEENVAIAWEFLKIYEPWEHEPAVYDCDAPEEFCPVCRSLGGPLVECENCGAYFLPLDEYQRDEWDDPLVSFDEANKLCHECLNHLRNSRQANKGCNNQKA